MRSGLFELDLAASELRKQGIRLHVPKQSLEILYLLVEHRELVGCDEIRRRLWPNGEIVEFEHSIDTAVRRLRDALGESASSPRLIETIPGRGYRLLLPVQPLGNSTRSPAPLPPAKPPVRAGMRWWWPIGRKHAASDEHF